MEYFSQESVFTAILNELKSLNLSKSVQIFACPMFSSLSIHLHNSGGMRPTVYRVEFPAKRSSLTVDTIVRENKNAHQSLKKHGHRDYIKNILVELSQQECDGSIEETEKNFVRLGCLYISK